MKKFVSVLLVSGLTLAGCDFAEEGTPIPAPSIVLPTVNPEPSKVPSSPSPTATPEMPDSTTIKPTVPDKATPSTEAPTGAGTPATQFASRWGKEYPAVPEYKILKAGKGVCLIISQVSGNWAQDDKAVAGIREATSWAGIEASQSFEFAQDAEQNYCPSLSNPV